MKSEHRTFGDQLTDAIRQPGTGARMQSASGGGSVAGGNTGPAELTTRATTTQTTQTEWMIGDPWTSAYFYKPYPIELSPENLNQT